MPSCDFSVPFRFLCALVLLASVAADSPAQKGERIKVPGDYATIMDAMDAAVAGDVISVAHGVYTEGVTLKAGVSVIGKGASKTLVRGAADAPVLTVVDAPRSRVEGLTFEHPKPEKKPDNGEPVALIASDHVTVVSCVFRNGHGDGIAIESGKKIVLDGCEVASSTENGIKIVAAEVELKNCKSAFNGIDGVRAERGARVTATRLRCEANQDAGIDAEGEDVRVKLIELSSKINAQRGVRLIKCHAILERPNVVANDAEGLYASGGELRIDGGTFRGNKKNGVALSSGVKGTIEGVASIANEQTGIAIVKVDTRAVIKKSDCRENKHYGILIHQGAVADVHDSKAHGNLYSGISAADKGTVVDFQRNQCRENRKHGLSVSLEARGTLTKNVAEKNRMQGIGILQKATAKLVRNTANENSSNGIQIWKGAQAELELNVCDRNTLSGIEVNGVGSTLKLKKNRCRRNLEYGVRFCSGAKPFRVGRDNLLTKNKRGRVKQ